MPAKSRGSTGKRKKREQKPLLITACDFFYPPDCNPGITSYFCAPEIVKAMAVTRLKRKNRKDKAKAAVRRQSLKLQNFKPVMQTVDVEKIKEEFKTKKA
jgi:hypothetical protein